MSEIPQTLTIAGSDSGGGAGIQADLKTFQELGVYGTSVITAVTAQNTTGVSAIYPMTSQAVQTQLEAIGSDFEIAALKTGMLFDPEIIEKTAAAIQRYSWKKLIVDPVMIAKGGAKLLQPEAVEALKFHLLPLAYLMTPNIPEAEALTGIAITDASSRRQAAEQILLLGAQSVVIKGGHEANTKYAEDYFLDTNGESILFRSDRIETDQTHGTGCTFAAAVTAELAKGRDLQEAICTAKEFIQAAISDPLNIGSGHGPTNHAAYKAGQAANREAARIEIFR
ncbi:bifunctional hydroxymethylpyrimidine kinase/phosphomethylpyrimidine kinase [Planococcus sp. CPCC 101016]|uniref:bifunctional hydroxymethylpyrimidine kinase/phosphomethylpyrimidine kinase n=1 Tax=Planococcus sp. CPCC 101016 TaxID=2599617 RepID=UPI0011B4A996|nr:bifunctional hydroxymethylpyrimidine kinase/phosphomethylpyrimidine kinase [Planococcus sp. CPCC 101016]TWT06616.1 bifunctional hydroxymethylpyrimidine kinase/phosphomethylpyrimidine kinase [Planococcus sp. CPCC 101016]